MNLPPVVLQYIIKELQTHINTNLTHRACMIGIDIPKLKSIIIRYPQLNPNTKGLTFLATQITKRATS